MVYTGFIGGQLNDVISPIMIKTRDILGQGQQHKRLVFNCFVVGHTYSGKSAWLDKIINQTIIPDNFLNDDVVDEANNFSSINVKVKHEKDKNQDIRSVVQAFGKKRNNQSSNVSDGLVKYIIFTEIPENQIQAVLKDQQIISKCDAIAFLYENDKDHIEFVRSNISKFP